MVEWKCLADDIDDSESDEDAEPVPDYPPTLADGDYEADPSILTEAARIVADRENRHGDAVETHRLTAALWRAYLGTDVDAHDAALMLGLLKIARDRTGEHDPDHYRDLAGHAECAHRCMEADRDE